MTRFWAPVRVATIALAIVATCFAHTGAAPVVSAQAEGACADNEGITIVVDFQELGGGVNARCAQSSVTDGFDALDVADIAWEGTLRFPGFLCRIAGFPTPDDEACANTPPATAYWTYWIAQRGGEWCYSNVGPISRTPPPGSIEGWSFALDKAESDLPPPRFDVPAAIPGETPNPLSGSDCTTPGAPASTTTTSTTSTTTTTTSTSTSTVAPAESGSTTTPASTPQATTPTSAPVQPSSSASPTSGDADAQAGGSASSTVATSTSIAPQPSSSAPLAASDPALETTTTRPSQGDSAGGGESSATGEGLDAAVPEPELALSGTGTIDLSDDRRGNGGFGVSSAVAIAAIIGVAASGIFAARRRRRPLQVET